jgi:hypothetical protein
MFHTKVVEKIKRHILCSVTFSFLNRTVYKIMWRNIAESGRPQTTIWRASIAYLILKATNSLSEYVILIFHFNNGYVNAPECHIAGLVLLQTCPGA